MGKSEHRHLCHSSLLLYPRHPFAALAMTPNKQHARGSSLRKHFHLDSHRIIETSIQLHVQVVLEVIDAAARKKSSLTPRKKCH